MLDSAFSSSPPHLLLHLATLFGTILLPLSLPPVLKSQWDLSEIPLLPLLFTDPSLTTHFL